jgi:hypothetical protein
MLITLIEIYLLGFFCTLATSLYALKVWEPPEHAREAYAQALADLENANETLWNGEVIMHSVGHATVFPWYVVVVIHAMLGSPNLYLLTKFQVDSLLFPPTPTAPPADLSASTTDTLGEPAPVAEREC